MPPIIRFSWRNSYNGSSYPEGNFGVNQLLDGSMGHSPLYPALTSDLHVNTATSTEVSSGFVLSRHSSPSFGSQQVHFTSNPFLDKIRTGPCCTLEGITRLPFSMPYGFNTLKLAHVLDSLDRVSRRVVRDRCV